MFAFECLYARHFVRADGVRVKLPVQLRRRGVGGADELHLRKESGIVLRLGIEPVTNPMRLEVGLTRAALAEKVGVSREVVANLEAGKIEPQTDLIEEIATALGRRLRDFAEE